MNMDYRLPASGDMFIDDNDINADEDIGVVARGTRTPTSPPHKKRGRKGKKRRGLKGPSDILGSDSSHKSPSRSDEFWNKSGSSSSQRYNTGNAGSRSRARGLQAMGAQEAAARNSMQSLSAQMERKKKARQKKRQKTRAGHLSKPPRRGYAELRLGPGNAPRRNQGSNAARGPASASGSASGRHRNPHAQPASTNGGGHIFNQHMPGNNNNNNKKKSKPRPQARPTQKYQPNGDRYNSNGGVEA